MERRELTVTKVRQPRMSQSVEQQAARIPWRKIRGFLFDWAGTTIDHGSLAPVEVVRAVFREFSIEVTEAEARQPMGKAKIDHLREVIAMPRIAQLWQQTHGQLADEPTILQIYHRFLVVQKTVLTKYADLIPGVLEFVHDLRAAGVKIGSTTGYTRELMEVILPIAARAGYDPNATVCSDEVTAGRPAPWSNFRAAELIGIYPMSEIVVVDDSIAGIQAGKSAGCYSVAVTTTGNPLGKSLAELSSMPEAEINRLHLQAEAEFYEAGADVVVESVSVVHELWRRLR